MIIGHSIKRWTIFDSKTVWRCRHEVMKNFVSGENIGLLACRQTAVDRWEHVSVTDSIADDSRISNRSKERTYVYPLYIIESNGDSVDIFDKYIMKPNIAENVINNYSESLNLQYSQAKSEKQSTFGPLDIF